MDSKKCNKISEIVRLQQILKKWKKLANTPKNSTNKTGSNNGSSSSSSKNASSINKLLKKTLSFTDISSSTDQVVVPKGFLAVCVGKELKRFIIPTEYLGHQAFGILLREAEEEFGFQKEGVLKIPCEVGVFERILKVVEDKTDYHHLIFLNNNNNNAHDKEIMNINGFCASSDSELTPSHHPQMCI